MLLVLVLLAGCGCGGGGSSAGASRGSGSAFEAQEYFASRGLEALGASPAYAAGATGNGILVGVIDTGIDIDNPEFAGAIHGKSIDIVAGSAATLDDADGHGTAVAGVIAARRNGALAHGVAFDADLLVIRADAPGSCASGCAFDLADVAAATDYAVDHGARVINYSLGGPGSLDGELGVALRRAVKAVSGTSFAAPHVTGAIALVLDAAPFLSARQAGKLLLETAIDLGAPGTDEVYGRGLLDLAAALGPQGPLTVPLGTSVDGAGSTLRETRLRLGGAFGPGPDLGRAIFLDGYGRAYWVDLDRQRGATRVTPYLPGWLAPDGEHLDFAAPLGAGGAVVPARWTAATADDLRLGGGRD